MSRITAESKQRLSEVERRTAGEGKERDRAIGSLFAGLMGFHADQEAMRVLALSLDAARLGQLALRVARPSAPAPLAEPRAEPSPAG
jgi:hypothetical protein